jgi:HSP20 family molecular chaperone IbpA
LSEKSNKPDPQRGRGTWSGIHTAAAQMAASCWRPLADVYRTRGGWIAKFELAGVAPEDLHIYANNRRLTVSGVRRDTVSEQACSHYLMEISYNRFERTIEIPCDFDSSHLLVEYRNGILVVRIDSKEGAAEDCS